MPPPRSRLWQVFAQRTPMTLPAFSRVPTAILNQTQPLSVTQPAVCSAAQLTPCSFPSSHQQTQPKYNHNTAPCKGQHSMHRRKLQLANLVWAAGGWRLVMAAALLTLHSRKRAIIIYYCMQGKKCGRFGSSQGQASYHPSRSPTPRLPKNVPTRQGRPSLPGRHPFQEAAPASLAADSHPKLGNWNISHHRLHFYAHRWRDLRR